MRFSLRSLFLLLFLVALGCGAWRCYAHVHSCNVVYSRWYGLEVRITYVRKPYGFHDKPTPIPRDTHFTIRDWKYAAYERGAATMIR